MNVLPPLPDEQRLRVTHAYPKGIVAGMHQMLALKGKNKMPLRAVLSAEDFAIIREHHLGNLPTLQSNYTDLHWAQLRLHHSVEEQRAWLDKQQL